MRKLVYYVAMTLDGFIAIPDGGDPSGSEYFPISPDVIGFMVERYPETLPGPARETMGIDGPGQSFDTVLEGRASYELCLAAGMTDAYPHLRHLVFSTTLQGRDPNVEVVRGGTLAHSLLPEIDCLVLKVSPFIIGSGIPLFNGAFQANKFKPVAQTQLGSGVRVLSYDRV